jgi:hypothetical protein
MKTLQLFYECWLEVTKQNRYRDKWLTDETYSRAIKAQFLTVELLGFDRGLMNKAVSNHGGSALDDLPNPIVPVDFGVTHTAATPLWASCYSPRRTSRTPPISCH